MLKVNSHILQVNASEDSDGLSVDMNSNPDTEKNLVHLNNGGIQINCIQILFCFIFSLVGCKDTTWTSRSWIFQTNTRTSKRDPTRSRRSWYSCKSTNRKWQDGCILYSDYPENNIGEICVFHLLNYLFRFLSLFGRKGIGCGRPCSKSNSCPRFSAHSGVVRTSLWFYSRGNKVLRAGYLCRKHSLRLNITYTEVSLAIEWLFFLTLN